MEQHPPLALAYGKAIGDTTWSVPNREQVRAICPHCGTFSQIKLGFTKVLIGAARAGQTQWVPDWKLGAAECIACSAPSFFWRGAQVYPSASLAPLPHPDMPVEINPEYSEAASILNQSPRAAAALLRLAVQKLCPLLGSTKSNLDDAIGELFAAQKISTELQQALDTLRVIGNESVHPGQINLNDDSATALALFQVLNFIVERGIAEPKRIAEIYGSLPASKVAAIENRTRRMSMDTE
jgi:hypothetical protein